MPKATLGDRSLFPNLTCEAYLAHAAIAPLSTPALDRISEVANAYAIGGMSGFAECAPMIKHTREVVAALIGASTDEIAFVANTTQGVIDIAFGLRWNTGDRVVLFDREFPANVIPWKQAAHEFDLELHWESLEPFERSVDEGIASVERVLQKGVRLVAVSAVQYRTGLRMPVERLAGLCREYGAELFVDAIQALGATPLDVGCGIDYLSSGSHKHLMGPEGSGLLYVSPTRASECSPRLAGWLSHEHAVDFLVGDEPLLRYDKPLRLGAKAFEIGTLNALGLSALGVSVQMLLELGVHSIHQHVNRYLDALEEGLRTRGFVSHRTAEVAGRSTLLGVTTPVDVPPTRLAKELSLRGVVCNTPDGLVRFAPHWHNHPDEVPVVLDAVDQALAAIRS